EPMEIDELSAKEAKLVVDSKLIKNPLSAGMSISEEAKQFAVDSSNEYIKTRPFPVKALNIIHETALASMEKGETKELKKEDIAIILQEKTGIAADELLANSWDNLVRLKNNLKQQVIGQDHAIDIVCEQINNYKM